MSKPIESDGEQIIFRTDIAKENLIHFVDHKGKLYGVRRWKDIITFYEVKQ